MGPSGPVIVPNDEVFILAGGIPPFGFLRELGVKFGGDQPDIVRGQGVASRTQSQPPFMVQPVAPRTEGDEVLQFIPAAA